MTLKSVAEISRTSITYATPIKRWRWPGLGTILFALCSVAGFLKAHLRGPPGHYRIFSGAGRRLWEGLNPYGDDYGMGLGNFLYSPSCGLGIFGPFSFLPEPLGLFLYLAVSWGVFVYGSLVFQKAFCSPTSTPTDGLMNLYWGLIGPLMFSAIAATKLEILMVGILLLASGWLLESRRMGASAGLLALILNWKFQPLPTLGLSLVAIVRHRGWRSAGLFTGALALFSVLWFGLPFVILGLPRALEFYQQWLLTLHQFIGEVWRAFDSLFSFVVVALKYDLDLRGCAVLSMSAALVLVTRLLGWPAAGVKQTAATGYRDTAGLALCLGASYTVLFSPLNQNSAYIQLAPLLLVSLHWIFELQHKRFRFDSVLFAMLVLGWSGILLAYGDLLPSSWRNYYREIRFKPFCNLILLVSVILLHRRILSRSPSRSVRE